MDRMSAAEDVEHDINTRSIDTTVRQGAQQPTQKPEGGAKGTPEKSKAQAKPPVPPKGATDEVVVDGVVKGHMVDGKYVPLK